MVVFGILLGLVYLVFVGPGLLFAVGHEHASVEISGIATLCLSFLSASILAIYRRLWAGVWLTIAGLYSAAIASWDAYSRLAERSIPIGVGEVFGAGTLSFIPILLGVFFWVTALRGWPELKHRRRLASGE
jgi:hypothetical protein